MKVSPAETPQFPPSSSPLRSGGEWGAGSSGRHVQRHPRTASTEGKGAALQRIASAPTVPDGNVFTAEVLKAAAQKLREQRRFRIDQLTDLLDSRTGAMDPGRAEVAVSLQTAARAALVDLDAALRRMERGTYGTCRRCGDAMSLARISALPMAPMCGLCQRTHDLPFATSPAHLRASSPCSRAQATSNSGFRPAASMSHRIEEGRTRRTETELEMSQTQ